MQLFPFTVCVKLRTNMVNVTILPMPIQPHPLCATQCHRDNNDIYAVNSMAFHPQFGTFATAGSDGTYNVWDKDSQQRLKAQNKCTYGTSPAPIPCGNFNKDGSIYAYAVSYDWSKGYSE